jgi:Mrp family chromosome partitioning ATPase
MDALKAAKFVEQLKIPVLGIVENMSGMICPHCKGRSTSLEGRGREDRRRTRRCVPRQHSP